MTKKPDHTLDELTKAAISHAKTDAALTEQINSLIKERNAVRLARRSIEGKITTLRINSHT